MGTRGKRWEVPSRQKYKGVITPSVLSQATSRKISDYVLAEEIGVPKHAIDWYRRKWGILSGRSDVVVQQMCEQKLTPEEEGLIIGTVLGDAHICVSQEVLGAWLTIQHGELQKEYVFHKWKHLQNLCLMEPELSTITCGYKPGTLTYRFSTIHHPGLLNLQRLLYNEEGRKVIRREALERLTLAGFAWWFFDDGSYSPKQRQYHLHTCQFSLEEQKIIRDWLFRKLCIYTTPIPVKSKEGSYYQLYFASRSRDRLSCILRSFAIPCLEYKIDRSSETTREALERDDDIVRSH